MINLGKKLLLAAITILISASNVFASDSLSYSGRLVNANGSPVTGTANLTFDLAYSGSPGIILCSQSLNGVDLSNGVFHVKLAFPDCTPEINTLLANTPVNETVVIRVTDRTPDPDKAYSFQAIHSVPYSFISQMTKQLAQMSAVDGQVLAWDNTAKKWLPKTPAASSGGTLTSISAGDGLSGGTITGSGTIAIATDGVTTTHIDDETITNSDISLTAEIAQSKIANLTTDLNNKEEKLPTGGVNTDYLDGTKVWKNFDESVRGSLLLNLGTGTAAPITDTNTVLEALENLQAQILSNDTAFDGTGQWDKTGNKIFYNTDNVGIGTANPNDKLEVVGNVALSGKVRLKDSGTNYVELKSPVTLGSTITITLPGTVGLNGQALISDGSGNLSWSTLSTDSSSIVDGSIVDADIAAGANIAQSKIAGLGTSLTSIQDSITNLNTGAVAEGSNLYFTEARVLGTDLAGLNTTAGTVTAADTVLSSLGKLIGNIATVSTSQSNYVLKSGDTMSGNLLMGGNFVTGLGEPLLDSDAATKKYVDDKTAASASQWTKIGSDIYYDAGNVGIGISAPNYHLTVAPIGVVVENSATVASQAQKDSTIAVQGAGQAYFLGRDVTNDIEFAMGSSSVGHAFSGSTTNHDYRLRTNNQDRLSITTGGNVGIGTVSPAAKLDVRGNLYIQDVSQSSGFKITNQSGKNYIESASANMTGAADLHFTDMNAINTWAIIKADGKFGIGTSTPVNKLDVAGDIGLTGKVRLKSSTANYVELMAPAGLLSTQTYTFPLNTGSAGHALITDGAGALSWSEVATTATNVGGDLSGSISNAQLVANSVGTAEIANASVTYAKLSLADGDVPVAKVNGLQTALDGKEPAITNPNDTLKYWRGDKTWATLNTSVVPESTNQYFTQQRVLDSLLAGYGAVAASALPIGDGESVLTSLKKLQLQITANDAAFDSTGQWGKNGTSVYYDGGNVGIGTTAPNAKLEVAGGGDPVAIRLTETTGTHAQWELRSYNIALAGGDNQFSIWGGLASGSQSDRLVISPSGNVGIGTNSPQGSLHVKTASPQTSSPEEGIFLGKSGSVGNLDYQLQLTTAGGGTPHIDISRGTNTDFDGRIASYADNQLSFGTATGGAQVLTINGSNVGIGTTNPAAKLTVASTTGSNVISIERPAGSFGLLKYSTDVNRRWEMGVSSTAESGSNAGSDFGLWSYGDDGTQSQILSVKRSSGNIGVGTTTPSYRLESSGPAQTSDFVALALAGKRTYVPGEFGTVSMNFTLPEGPLSSDRVQGIIRVGHEQDNTSAEGFMSFFTRITGVPTEKMRLTSDGKLGVGTSAPAEKLHVMGYARLTGASAVLQLNETDGLMNTWWLTADGNYFSIRKNNAGTYPFVISDAGNIGISNSAPTYKLDVSGDLRITGTPYRNGGDIAWTVPSDKRLKDITGTHDYGLEEIAKLKTLKYKYKENNPAGATTDQEYIGVLAQDVQKVIPEAVSVNPENGFLNLNSGPIFWTMVKATKELKEKADASQKKVEELKRGLASLKEENEKLKKQNESFEKRLEALEKKSNQRPSIKE